MVYNFFLSNLVYKYNHYDYDSELQFPLRSLVRAELDKAPRKETSVNKLVCLYAVVA